MAARAISAGEKLDDRRGYASWNLRERIELLIRLLPHLPEPYLAEAAAAAIRLIVDESSEMLDTARFDLGRVLPKELLPDAVVRDCTRPGAAAFLPDDLVVAALEVARREEERAVAVRAHTAPGPGGPARGAAGSA